MCKCNGPLWSNIQNRVTNTVICWEKAKLSPLEIWTNAMLQTAKR